MQVLIDSDTHLVEHDFETVLRLVLETIFDLANTRTSGSDDFSIICDVRLQAGGTNSDF